jgi:hypothetical protein
MSTYQPTMRAQPTRRKKISWRWGIAVVAVLLAVVGLGLTLFTRVGTAHASGVSTTFSESFPINRTVFVSCAAGGAGEDVFLSGDLHELVHATFAADGSFFEDFSENFQDVSGVGLTTGAKYQGTGVTRFDLHEASAIFPVIDTQVSNFRIIGQGPDNNFLVHDNFQVTANADGTVTASHNNFSLTCM